MQPFPFDPGLSGPVGGPDAPGSPDPTATVCFVRRDGKVLLQRRAPGRLWAGRLNGPGGKVMDGETPEAAIVREVAEETGLRLADPMRHGTLDLVFGTPQRTRLVVIVYACRRFAGRARGGREGALRWYAEDRLPFDRLWPDMRYWLPVVLDGGTVEGSCAFDDEGERLLSGSLRLEWGSGAAPTGEATGLASSPDRKKRAGQDREQQSRSFSRI